MPKKVKGERPFNFGCLPLKYSYEEAKVVILPIPYELTTTYKPGTREAPLLIIQASRYLELYDQELEYEPYKVGIYTQEELEFSVKDPKKPINQIKEAVKKIIGKSKFPVIIGGEHTISLGVVLALKEKYPHLSVLQLDAHPDLYDTYQETKYSHATVMRRIKEVCAICQAGIRTLSLKEATYLKSQKESALFTAREMIKSEKTFQEITNSLSNEVYITIDLDVFDPSLMPAVGTPEPGGLFWYDLLSLLKIVFAQKNVVGFDLVELCPLPGMVAPDFLAAKLIYKLIGYKFAKSSPQPTVNSP